MFTADGYQPSIRAGKRGIDAPWEHQPAETEHLGSGHGHSVLEVLEAFGLAISYVLKQWRSGDAVITVADPAEADQQLIWQISCRRDPFLAAGQSERLR